MEGTVSRIVNDGGVISSAAHGDINFVWPDVPRGLRLRQNQQVEFDVGDDGQGGEKAINIRQVRQQPAISATVRFGELVDSATCRLVPCTVTLERGNRPVVDMKVKATANGNRQTYPLAEPKTDTFGKVYFGIALSPGETHADVAIEANGSGYTATWKLPKPKPELTVEESDGPGWKNLVVNYADGETLIPATLELWPTNGCHIAFREAGQTAWKKITGKTKVPTTGRSILQVKVVKAPKGIGGENIFVGVEGSLSHKGPFYVSASL